MPSYQFPSNSPVQGGGGSGQGFEDVVAKTSGYLITSGDNGTVFTFNGTALTATLPSSAPAESWMVTVINLNTSPMTLSPNGNQLNGQAGSLTLAQYQAVIVVTDGSNYFYDLGYSGSSSFSGGSALSVPGTAVCDGISIYDVAAPASAGWNSYTMFALIPSAKLVACNSWKFTLGFVAGSAAVLGGAVVYKCARFSKTILSTTNVTFNGGASYPVTLTLSSPSTSNPNLFDSDAISLPLDNAHDYYIAVYLNTNASNNSPMNVAQGPTSYTAGMYGGYSTGSQLALSTFSTNDKAIGSQMFCILAAAVVS